MKDESIAILSGSYTRTEPPVLQYHGITKEEGKSAMLEIHNFRPYMEITFPDTMTEQARRKVIKNVRKQKEYLDDEQIVRKVPIEHCEETGFRIYTRGPWMVPTLRKMIEEEYDYTVHIWAADIPFHLRALYDIGGGCFVEVHGNRLLDVDAVDVKMVVDYSDDNYKISRTDMWAIDPKIFCFDIEQSIKTKRILCIGWTTGVDSGCIGTPEMSEKEILLEFEKKIIDLNPDVLMAFNNNFDFEQINLRAMAILRRDIVSGRNGRRWYHRNVSKGTGWKCGGRLVIDSMLVAKMRLNPRRMSLAYLSETLLGEGKDPINASEIDMEWATRPYEVTKYSEKDAVLALKIIRHPKVDAIGFYSALAAVSGIPVEDTMGKTTTRVDALLIPEADKRGYGVPTNKYGFNADEKIKGAYVHQPEPGLHDWVVCLDVSCFAEGTELLTIRGWEMVEDVKEGDRIYTFNPETSEVVIDEVKKYYEYDYEGEMYQFEGVGIDQLVTPNHRMVYQQQNRDPDREKTGIKGKWKVNEAQHVKDFVAIPAFGDVNRRDIDIINIGEFACAADGMLNWLGWVLSEGYLSKNSVSVSQAEPAKIPIVREAFREIAFLLNINFKETTHYREDWIDGIYERKHKMIHTFAFHHTKFTNALKEFLGGWKSIDKQIPRLLLNTISQRQAQILLESLTMGDGHRTESLWTYTSISEQLADDVQVLALIAGYSASVSSYSVTRVGNPVYVVGISRKRRNVIRKSRGHLTTTHYSGKVRCVSVPGGAVICRRNGKASVSGNSMYPTAMMEMNACFTTWKGTTIDEDEQVVATYHNDWDSIIPAKMRELKAKRNRYKELMKSSTGDERSFYNGLQLAVKILMNAFYGCLTASFYRFTNKTIGSSITSWSRRKIRGIVHDLTSTGFVVIAGDTDSVFVRLDEHLTSENKLEEAITKATNLATGYSHGDFILELEKIINPFFTADVKKRYFGQIIYPREEFLVKGFEVRRTDPFNLLTATMKSVMEKVMERDGASACKIAKTAVRNLIESPDKDSLIISKTCKDPSEYVTPNSIAQVQAARKLLLKGIDFPWGMKISYIVTNASKTPAMVEPIIEGEEIPEPDIKYYANRLAVSIGRITKSFGWDNTDLLIGKRQTSLFEFG